jgi:hypothetical protein
MPPVRPLVTLQLGDAPIQAYYDAPWILVLAQEPQQSPHWLLYHLKAPHAALAVDPALRPLIHDHGFCFFSPTQGLLTAAQEKAFPQHPANQAMASTHSYPLPTGGLLWLQDGHPVAGFLPGHPQGLIWQEVKNPAPVLIHHSMEDISSQPLLFPVPVLMNQHFVWRTQEGYQRLLPTGTVSPLPQPPTLRSMEQAIPLSPEGHTWLILGGARGDLDSFGFRLHQPLGALSGQGIVLKYHRHANGTLTVITTPASVRTQLWFKLRNKQIVTCHTFLATGKGYVPDRKEEVELKPEDDHLCELIPGMDLNGDGTGDLLRCDRRGLALGLRPPAAGERVASWVPLEGAFTHVQDIFVHSPYFFVVQQDNATKTWSLGLFGPREDRPETKP